MHLFQKWVLPTQYKRNRRKKIYLNLVSVFLTISSQHCFRSFFFLAFPALFLCRAITCKINQLSSPFSARVWYGERMRPFFFLPFFLMLIFLSLLVFCNKKFLVKYFSQNFFQVLIFYFSSDANVEQLLNLSICYN